MLRRTDLTIDYHQPPKTHHSKGIRRVGFELEFTGLDLDTAGQCLISALPGKLIEQNTAAQKILSKELGEFTVEIDWDYLKKAASAADSSPQHLHLLRELVSPFVPVEVVCPPVALDNLAALDPLVQALQQAGARGTDDSLIAAFGVHLNPELPSLDKGVIENYLRAFALLQWWLVKQHEVDLSRRLTPYIDLYPDAYLKQLLSYTAADRETLIDDYLDFNPSRNRALDMLPLFSELDAGRVRQRVEDTRIKPRPTFHYRLPNCLIGDPDWSLARAWNIWCVVEELAMQPEQIAELSERFLGAWRPLLGVDQHSWVEHIDEWVKRCTWV
ncbi:MAG: amidoligase family protein [Pseudomonadales bacterium]|nr:amidoligase family protein [Pseudomonadales bacterium]